MVSLAMIHNTKIRSRLFITISRTKLRLHYLGSGRPNVPSCNTAIGRRCKKLNAFVFLIGNCLTEFGHFDPGWYPLNRCDWAFEQGSAWFQKILVKKSSCRTLALWPFSMAETATHITIGVSGPCSSPNRLCFFFCWLFSLLVASFSW